MRSPIATRYSHIQQGQLQTPAPQAQVDLANLESKLPDLAFNRYEKNTDINALTDELRSIRADFIKKTSTDKELIDSKGKQIAILIDELTVENKEIDKIKKAASLREKEHFEQES